MKEDPLPNINTQPSQKDLNKTNINKLQLLAQNDPEFRYNQQKFFDLQPDPSDEADKNWSNFYEGKSSSSPSPEKSKPAVTRNMNSIQKMNTYDGAKYDDSKRDLNNRSLNHDSLRDKRTQNGLSIMNSNSTIKQYKLNSSLQRR